MNDKNPPKNASYNTKPQKKFVVNRLEDLIHRVIPHFDAFQLQTKKATDYRTWREIVMFVYHNLYGKKGWVRRFPQETAHLQLKCGELRTGRAYIHTGVLQ